MTKPLDMQPVKSGSLRSQVVDALKLAILTGRLHPGDPIREVHAGAELGVSQNTIREALMHLEQLGLVVRNPNRNTTVAKLSDREIEERISLRSMLEPRCFSLAAKRMEARDFEQLRERVGDMRRALAGGSEFEFCQSDLHFHRQVWELSGHRILAATLEQALTPMFAFVSILYARRAENLETVPAQHEELVQVLETRDAALIERRVREHLVNAYEEFLTPGSGLWD